MALLSLRETRFNLVRLMIENIFFSKLNFIIKMQNKIYFKIETISLLKVIILIENEFF